MIVWTGATGSAEGSGVLNSVALSWDRYSRILATGLRYVVPRGSTCGGWLTPRPSRKRSSKESLRVREALAEARASRAHTFVMPLAIMILSVAPSRTAPFEKDSRTPMPSGYQRHV
jgi:hypothetical protein